MNKKLIILQINEVNFDLVKKYISKNYLPNFKYFLNKFNFLETSSEEKYENLEPWIQWVSFYSGKKFSEHKVSHLNDFDEKEWNFLKDLEQKYNKRLALLFPMNLKNNFNEKSLFIPDPWTETSINASKSIKKIFYIFKNIILENAGNNIKFSDLISILNFSLFKTSINFKLFIIKNFLKIIKYKFYKAIIFDYLCWEIFKLVKKNNNYDIFSLFLNSCAHIQHHYFLNSSVEHFENKNPTWYIKNVDPILECLKAYDYFLEEFKKEKNVEFLIITGLSQTAITNPVYYYNLKDHNNFFKKIGVNFTKIIKRMSRDYTLYFENKEDLNVAEIKISSLKLNGQNIFSFKISENRAYVELIYDKEIKKKDIINIDHQKLILKENVNFIAIKNSIHNQKGYLITSIKDYKEPLKIWDVHKKISNEYGE